MPFGLKIKLKLTGVVNATRRRFAKHQKEGFLRLGATWHKQFRPKHFTRRGAAEYGYDRRTRRYTATKMRRFGHADPLVFTGESRTLAKARRLTGTSKGSRLTMNVPALNRRPKGKKQSMRDEMTVTSEGEMVRLTGQLAKFLAFRLDNLKARVRKVR